MLEILFLIVVCAIIMLSNIKKPSNDWSNTAAHLYDDFNLKHDECNEKYAKEDKMEIKEQQFEGECNDKASRQANSWQEAWVKSRVLTAIRMAIAINKESRISEDDELKIHALNGLAEGAAIAIIYMLSRDPEHINLPDLRQTKEL